jgi:glutamate synthase (NADPH/NADH) small chain
VISAESLVESHDAVVLCGGSTNPRDLGIPGRELEGIHFAMEFLKPANMVQDASLDAPIIDAKDRDVVIIGGGDTGADCLGTSHRHGARSVTQIEIMPAPPEERASSNPWPTYPVVLKVTSAHEEGGERLYQLTTTEFVGDEEGRVRALRTQEVESVVRPDGSTALEPVPGSEGEIKADLVLLAMGFVGPERLGVLAELGLDLDGRGNVVASKSWETSRPGVFVSGDMTRGQSLIVWAIAEGRSAAAAVDRYLMGTTDLPSPLEPGTLALR